MNKHEIGRFYATTFDEKVYEFIVKDNGLIECPALSIDDAFKIVIKPRFELINKSLSFINPAKHGVVDNLIRDFDIDENTFDYLKEHNMIMYSTDMAHLYGFEDKDGFDREFKEGHPFKWAKKKNKVLVKWKQGYFN